MITRVAIEELRVSGSIKLRGPLKIISASITGSLAVDGEVKVDRLSISGSAKIDGRLVGDEVKVSGSMSVKASIEASELRVSGSLDVAERIKASFLEVSGSLKTSFIEANEALLSGKILAEKITGRKIIVGKKSEVKGTIIGCEVEVDKEAEVERVVSDKVFIRKNAEVNYVEANHVVIERKAEVGELLYVREAVIHEDAKVYSKRKVETLSEKIECGD